MTFKQVIWRLIIVQKFKCALVADPEGVRGVQTNPLLSLNYFIFHGEFQEKFVKLHKSNPLSANLNRRSKNPGSAPVPWIDS